MRVKDEQKRFLHRMLEEPAYRELDRWTCGDLRLSLKFGDFLRANHYVRRPSKPEDRYTQNGEKAKVHYELDEAGQAEAEK